MAARRLGEGFEAVRREFGLSRPQLLIACDTGLLNRLADGSIASPGVEAARADPADFARRLGLATPLDIKAAAARLGTSWARARRLIEAAGLEACEEETTRYRTVIRRFGAGDIDTLMGAVTVDVAERAVAVAAGRSEAARKGAETRRRNRARAEEARATLGRPPAGDAAWQVRLWWAAALSLVVDADSRFDAYSGLRSVRQLAELLTVARFETSTLRQWMADLEDALDHPTVISGAAAAKRLGLHDSDYAGRHCPSLDGWVSEADVETMARLAPQHLVEARAAQAARVSAQRERQQLEARRTREEAAVQAAAMAAIPDRMGSGVVAELLGCPGDVVAGMRPKGGWAPDVVASLVRDLPWWAVDHDAARVHIAERTAAKAASLERGRGRRAQKRAGWTRAWASQLDVEPALVVAAGLDRVKPTSNAVAGVRRYPPGVLKEAITVRRRPGGAQ